MSEKLKAKFFVNRNTCPFPTIYLKQSFGWNWMPFSANNSWWINSSVFKWKSIFLTSNWTENFISETKLFFKIHSRLPSAIEDSPKMTSLLILSDFCSASYSSWPNLKQNKLKILIKTRENWVDTLFCTLIYELLLRLKAVRSVE